MVYEDLLDLASGYGLYVYEVRFQSRAKGIIRGNLVGVESQLPQTEKACALVEEIAHRVTSVGNILNQSDIRNRKQELRARQWAYECMIPVERIIQAHYARITGSYDLAEYLGVTQDFLQDAIDRYTSKYGIYLRVDERHTIQFDPLRVI